MDQKPMLADIHAEHDGHDTSTHAGHAAQPMTAMPEKHEDMANMSGMVMPPSSNTAHNVPNGHDPHAGHSMDAHAMMGHAGMSAASMASDMRNRSCCSWLPPPNRAANIPWPRR